MSSKVCFAGVSIAVAATIERFCAQNRSPIWANFSLQDITKDDSLLPRHGATHVVNL
jgi:hypothetical protein